MIEKSIPVRFVIATEDGHLDNFPFDWYVHIKNKKPEQVGEKSTFLKTKGSTASLKNIVLESQKQNGDFICSISLERIFDQKDTFVDLKDAQNDYLQYVNGKMPKPWLGRIEKTKDFSCTQLMMLNGLRIQNQHPIEKEYNSKTISSNTTTWCWELVFSNNL